MPEIIEHISKIHEAEKHYHRKAIESFNLELEQINVQMDKITDLLVNDTISKDTYDRKFSQLQTRRKEISTSQAEHQGGNEEFKHAITTLVSLSSKAPEIFRSSKTPIKRALISTVFSNLRLNGGKLDYALAEPFGSFQYLSDYKKWLGWHHSII